MRRLGHVPALDGLRGVAVLLVVGRHYFLFPLGGGGTGVGIFFVLSGFLITTLLLEEHDATGRIRLRAFYARRARRLLPALAVLLAAYLAGSIVEGRTHVALRAIVAGGFYTANVAQSYWPHLIGREPIGPLWSLAEEEQFYLVWPAVLIAVLAWKLRGRYLALFLTVTITLICAERLWLMAHHANNVRTYASPETAADGLLAGVLLALFIRRGGRINRVFASVALMLLFLATWLGAVVGIYGPLVDLAGFALIGLAVEDRSFVSQVLSWRPLTWVGLISYSLYLFHMVVLSWLGYQDRGLALAMSAAMAWLSWRYVETRFRRRKSAVAIEAAVPIVSRPAEA